MLPILKPTHTFRENQVLTPEEQQQIANGDGIKIKTYDIINGAFIGDIDFVNYKSNSNSPSQYTTLNYPSDSISKCESASSNECCLKEIPSTMSTMNCHFICEEIARPGHRYRCTPREILESGETTKVPFSFYDNLGTILNPKLALVSPPLNSYCVCVSN